VVQSKLRRWFVEHIQPVLDAYFAGDLAAARTAYSAALANLDEEPELDTREAKRLRLETSWFMVLAALGEDAEARAVYTRLLADCQAAEAGSDSQQIARSCELMARLRADDLGLDSVPVEDGHRLADAVPEEMRGPHYWHELGGWAFRHGDAELLEEAYAYFTTQRIAAQADWLYSRLQLMWRLHLGQATEEHVRQAVSRIEVAGELQDFNQRLRPACAAQGILSPAVELELEAKALEMAASGKRRPKRGG
jgi:hypothetical protein